MREAATGGRLDTKETEQVRHLVRKMMTTAAKLKVPLEVDIK
jgi:DNA polymerase I-like protein with 3'-5' exonuclease and polymerase domains